MIRNLIDLSRGLEAGRILSLDLAQDVFQAVDSAGDEAARIFLTVYREAAEAQASWIDEARGKGIDLPRYAGVPIAIKNLFDVAGEVTRAGSKVLDARQPASTDAEVVRRLRRAGFVIVGKSNMTEFAYSGLGVNSHFGTPRNPNDAETARIPGGSSSGAAVAVAREMVPAAIGTDTGGSCRIPAAFCGIVGFKPSSWRVPKNGVVPLSRTFDCVGPLAHDVSSCSVLDDILSGGRGEDVLSHPEGGLRVGALETYVTDDLDEVVTEAYQQALTRLSRRGVRLVPVSIRELEELPAINAKGGYVGAEAYAFHKPLLESRREHYDPWVRARFDSGKSQSAEEFIRLTEDRARIKLVSDDRQSAFDAFVLPTVPIVPPELGDLEDHERLNAINRLSLRNTAVGNFLDLPAISIPCHGADSLPVGLMLMGRRGEDRRLLSIARGLEQAIRGR